MINRDIELFDWDKSFEDTNVHNQVRVFNKTMLNIFHNFISNKNITCNDKNPPWLNDEIRQMINNENEIYR